MNLLKMNLLKLDTGDGHTGEKYPASSVKICSNNFSEELADRLH